MNIELQATGIADKTYDLIRGDIIFARLAPGTKLKLERLTRDYGASVSTLREILSRLSSEGFVLAEGQRGFRVAPATPSGFAEVASMRLLLEQYAVTLSFAVGDLDWEGRVVAAYHKLSLMERRMLSGDGKDAETWKRFDREFHQTLIAACGSQALLDIYGGIYDQYLRYQMIGVVFRGQAAAAEHKQLLDFALLRDAEGACRVLRDHVEGCVAHTLAGGSLVVAQASAFQDLPETVGESMYRRIRSDILFGTLQPGKRLKLEELKLEYGVSVSTLREILNRLTSERLVIAEGQRGFAVAPVSVSGLKEIAALRQLLEGHALKESFKVGDLEWESRVVGAHHRLSRMEQRMEAGDKSGTALWKQYDWQFHQSLISACGSRLLVETHAAVFEKYLRYQMIALSFRGEIAADEHAALLNCALRREADLACDILTEHVAGGVEHALATGTISH